MAAPDARRRAGPACGGGRRAPRDAVCLATLFLLVVVTTLVGLAAAIRPGASDDHVVGFWVGPKEVGRRTVSLVTSRGETAVCTFDYDTNPHSAQKEEEKSEPPPDQILASLMDSPCLSHQFDHSYKLCIGRNATQIVSGQKVGPLSLGSFSGWNGPEQVYQGGSADHCQEARSATVHFMCDDKLRVASASEPSMCKYRFVVGAPEACGYKIFSQTVLAQTLLETWYMEIFEAHDKAIGCVVHAAGFGLTSPALSTLITTFKLKLEKDNKPLPIADFEARYGARKTYLESQVNLNDEGTSLLPHTLPLPAAPNYLALTC